MNQNKNEVKLLFIGYSKPTEEDKAVLTVGVPGSAKTIDIVNAFEGKEAEELFKRLSTSRF